MRTKTKGGSKSSPNIHTSSGIRRLVSRLLAGSKNAQTNIKNVDVRYVLPYLLP
jgi:hypothetical protein